MRGLTDENFANKFKNGELKPIIDFVKNSKNKEVFIGVRNNYVDIYVNGGVCLDIRYNEFNIDKNYLSEDIIKKLPSKTDTNSWLKILPTLKEIVAVHHKCKIGTEKYFRQQLISEFNTTNSDYYAFDIEYTPEINDYIEVNENNFGQPDMLLISKPKNNKVNVYLGEVKYGTNAYALGSKEYNEGKSGSGIVGHILKYTKLIQLFQSNLNILQNEIRQIMKFYYDNELIKNQNFAIGNFDNIEIENIKVVFFLGNYPENCETFEGYLGINQKGRTSEYSLKSILNNDNAIKQLNYISKEEFNNVDFKYMKFTKEQDEKCNFNLEIESYPSIDKSKF